MLKRNIAILIAGGLLGAQVTLAAPNESAFPVSENDQLGNLHPAQIKYLEERAARIQGVARGDVFPPSADDLYGKMLPAQAKYFAEREVSNQTATLGEVTVNITASTKYINAEHDGVLVIKNDKGQSFTWRADTLGEADIPLKAIAPTDFAAGQTRVFVRHPAAHIPG